MRQSERLDLIREAVQKARDDFKEVENKYQPDDGDGLFGEMNRQKRISSEKYAALQRFFNEVVNAVEYP